VSTDVEARAEKIYGCEAERFVHRHYEIASAQNTVLAALRFLKGLTEHDADIFDRVVLIHSRSPLACKEFQHLIEESDSGGNPITATVVDGQHKRGRRSPSWCAGWWLSSFRPCLVHADFLEGFPERCEQSLGLLSGSKRNVHATRTTVVGGAVAHQDSTPLHGPNEGGLPRTEASHYKIGLTGPVRTPPHGTVGWSSYVPGELGRCTRGYSPGLPNAVSKQASATPLTS